MGDTGAHGRVQGKLGAWHPGHSSVHPAPLLTHGKCRGKGGARHLKGTRGQPGGGRSSEPISRDVPDPRSRMWTLCRHTEQGFGLRGLKTALKSHLCRRMLNIPSAPLASSTRPQTPGMSWHASEQALGEFEPDAGGCLVPEPGGELKQVGAPPSASLQGGPGARLDASRQPRAPSQPRPPLLGLGILVLPG